MNVLMSCSVGRFDLAGHPKMWFVVASKMVRVEVSFWQ